MDEIARDSWSAWLQLKLLGGIEPKGRDRDFIAALIEELSPGAISFEAAVREVGTEQLVRAVFRRIAPFAEMFVDIVEFFKSAGATAGREHWQVKLDGSILELAHFESFQQRWQEIEGMLDVPVAGVDVMWSVREEVSKTAGRDEGSEAKSLRSGVDEWFDTYMAGQYRSLPSSLLRDVPAELTELASIATVMSERLRETFRSRLAIKHAWYDSTGTRVFDAVPDDAFAVGSMAQLESDFWLGKLVKGLAWWLEHPGTERMAMAQAAGGLMAHLPRRQFPISVATSELEAILKLPVWQRRHELYAVWIGTRIVAALPDRTVEIHHQDGRIVFAFKETVIATIKDAAPPIRLIGERRSSLEKPLGKGRVNGVQPDYGLWSDEADMERCILVIEVKHYGRAARRKFHEVVVDYAAAHPSAKVVLVNHGPVADMLDGVSDDMLARCRQLGNLTPTNMAQLEVLKQLVRKAVAEAEAVNVVARAPGPREERALVVDVSSSMKPLLRDAAFAQNLEHHLDRFGLMVLVDTAIRVTCDAETVIDFARACDGGNTDLVPAVRSIFAGRKAVVVITDDDGVAQMETLRDDFAVTSESWGDAGLRVVVASTSSHGPLTRQVSEALQADMDRQT